MAAVTLGLGCGVLSLLAVPVVLALTLYMS